MRYVACLAAGLLAGFVAVSAALPVHAQNPIDTDGDKYKVVLENDRVRVLEYKDLPGEKTNQHRHPAFVLYALGPFKRTLTLPDGKVLTREFKAGDTMWSDEQIHIGANVGDTPTHVLIVELKEPAKKRE